MNKDSWVSIRHAHNLNKSVSIDYDLYWDDTQYVQVLHIARQYKNSFLITCWNGDAIFQFIGDGDVKIWSMTPIRW